MKGLDIDAIRSALGADGVVHIPRFLSPAELADIEECYNWSKDFPGRGHAFGDDPNAWSDICNPQAYEAYAPMLKRSPIPRLLSGIWQGPVWFMYENPFFKKDTVGRTAWHQDTSYEPVSGPDIASVWISFDTVKREQALEFCLESHRGTLYNGAAFLPGDPTAPFYPSDALPRLPNIEAERDKWNIAGFATEPGDIILFHNQMLHGGGTPGRTGLRRTLVMRFFGNDTYYDTRPGLAPAPQIAGLHESMKQGDPFRHPAFPQVA